jgi:hypothetical protein
MDADHFEMSVRSSGKIIAPGISGGGCFSLPSLDLEHADRDIGLQVEVEGGEGELERELERGVVAGV